MHQRTLGPGEHPLALVESLIAQAGEVAPEALEKGLIHKAGIIPKGPGRPPAVAFEPPEVAAKHVAGTRALQTAT